MDRSKKKKNDADHYQEWMESWYYWKLVLSPLCVAGSNPAQLTAGV